jgi:hypothetical protein
MAANQHLLAPLSYAAFHRKLPFLELDYTASAIYIGILHSPVDSQAPKSIV